MLGQVNRNLRASIARADDEDALSRVARWLAVRRGALNTPGVGVLARIADLVGVGENAGGRDERLGRPLALWRLDYPQLIAAIRAT